MTSGLVHPVPPRPATLAAPTASLALKTLVVLIHVAAAAVQVRLHIASFWNVDLSSWWPAMLGMLVTAGCLFAMVFMEQVDGRQVGPTYVLGFNLGMVLVHVGLSVHWALRSMGVAPDEPGWLAGLHGLLDSAWLYWGLYPAALVTNWIVMRRRSAPSPLLTPASSWLSASSLSSPPPAGRIEPHGHAGRADPAPRLSAVRC